MNNFNSNYKPYSGQISGSQQNQKFGLNSNRQGFPSQGFSSQQSFSRFDNKQSSFGSTLGSPFGRQQGFGQTPNQFSSLSQKPISSSYSLGAQPYQTRPMTTNRPISVYGNNSGFYFPRTNYNSLSQNNQYQPRQNNSIMFNNTTQPPLVAPVTPAAPVSNNSQENYNEQYTDNQHTNEQYNDQYVDGQNNYEGQYTDQYEDPSINYAYIKSVLDELSQSSNSENTKAAVVADASGNIIAQGYNFIDEDGNEYQAEDYALQALGEISWDPNTSIMFLNAPLTEDTANASVSYGIKNIQVLTTNSKDTKKFKKNKGMKIATSILEENGVSIEILELQE